jgi:phosphate transport system substrate-binding protein
VLGAVVITYNLPDVTKPLNLTGPVVAQIFLGKITKWNAPEIVSLNPGVTLPNKDISLCIAQRGSGTTYIFSDYLAAVSPAWAAGPGKGKELQWPVGLGGQGNPGVAGQIRQLPGSIGYIELAYARQNKLAYAALKNACGCVRPSDDRVGDGGCCCRRREATSDDRLRVSIVNAAGKTAYPISSFTYLLVYQTQTDAAKGKKLIDFIKWAIHDGEADAAKLDYAPLPTNVVALLDKRLTAVKNVAAK